MRQIPLPIGPLAQPDYENFLAGPNAAALMHLRALAAPGEASAPSAPVYLWGPAGSGKTHLLRALAAARRGGERQVGWFDAADAAPWSLPMAASLVVIDRCDALDAARQQAAFGLFVEATTLGIQLAAAGRLPPVDLPLRDDLRSRLGWGLVFALEPLGEVETRAVLKRELDLRGMRLSDELMNYLLTHFERDLSHLMSLIDRLDRFGLAEGRQISLPQLRRMLADEGAAAGVAASVMADCA